MNKRFRVNELVKYNYSDIGEYTDENHTDTPLRNDEICDLLNEQHEQIQELQMRYDAQRELYCELDCVKNNLYQENKQLKQQLKELKEDAPLLLAFYRWYPFAVEKKEHQAYNRLWDFVND